ncbi:unannotated protein [freshwater metagenome]|uniref:Unannotated protein n=1 Tax=freshwater metagenome TaxID=449393 RepID=A0A6J7N6Q1_9ZZZZ
MDEIELLEHPEGPLGYLLLLLAPDCRDEGPKEPLAALTLCAQTHVLKDCELVQDLRELKCPDHALAGNLVGGSPGERRALE